MMRLPSDDNEHCGRRRFSRRALFGTSAGGALLLAGCGGSVAKPTSGKPTLIAPTGTPAIAVAGFDEPTRWQGQTLKVATFLGDLQAALRTAIFDPFCAATGCAIAEYETDYAVLADSTESGHVYADVLLVDSVWAASGEASAYVQAPLAQTIDRARFAPIAPTDSMIPAYAYALVSAFRYDAVLRIGEPQSWPEWWDTLRFSGARAMPRGALGNFEFALIAAGAPPDQLYPLDGAAAIESLKAISGKIVDRWWDSAQQPVAWLSSAKTAFTPAWHFRVQSNRGDRPQFDMTWSQGLLLYDAWVVAKEAERVDIAADFLRFATSAEAQAKLASTLHLGPVTPDALTLLDSRELALLPTADQNLSKLIALDTGWWATNNVEANAQFNSWLLGVPFEG